MSFGNRLVVIGNGFAGSMVVAGVIEKAQAAKKVGWMTRIIYFDILQM